MQPTLQEPVKLGMMIYPGKIASTLPLDQTRVNANITGLISTVTVMQSFTNPFNTPIELEYIFPLPENAALVDFSIQIGPRIVHAEIRELEQAKQAYEKAKQEGRQAAILDQRRPNLFAIQLANVLPGHPIQASIAYENRLNINVDELQFIFPMGLTPKYHSETHPDESRGVDAPVAFPGEKIGHVEIEITASLGFKAGDPTSPSHNLSLERLGEDQFTINLKGRYIPDHDFVLRFPVIQNNVQPAVWCTRDSSSEIALVNWLPIAEGMAVPVSHPREFVFVLDRSGSMSGEPIRQARNALCACLRILEPQDTFRILLFDDRLEWYRPESVQVVQNEIDQADQFLTTIEGRGGTEIVQAVEEALSLPVDSERIRYVLFLTDGAVSAEDRTLQTIRKKIKQTRMFTFGIGPSVNRALLSKIAQIGRGSAEFLQLDEDIEGTILRFQDKVAFPVLTDIHLDWIGCTAWDAIPAMLPDLYFGQSLQFVSKLKRKSIDQSPRLRVTGLRGREKVAIEVSLPGGEPDLPEIKRAWARARIDEVIEQSASSETALHKVRQEVISLALEYRLVTQYTAFVALDPEVVNPQGEMLTVAVSQPLPKGLDQAGFFSPSPVPMVAASLVMPAMPKMMRARPATGDIAAREKADGNDSYHQNFASLTSFPDAFSEILSPSPAVGKPENLRDSLGGKTVDPEETLRWLARTQNLNGSWSDDVELTAVALLVFVRKGNTTRRGYYRKQVRRAAEWLLQTSCDGTPAHAHAFALHELELADPHLNLSQQIKNALDQLKPAKTQFERIVQSQLINPKDIGAEPHAITDLDSLRIACVLKLRLEVPAELIQNGPNDLVRVWMAGMIQSG